MKRLMRVKCSLCISLVIAYTVMESTRAFFYSIVSSSSKFNMNESILHRISENHYFVTSRRCMSVNLRKKNAVNLEYTKEVLNGKNSTSDNTETKVMSVSAEISDEEVLLACRAYLQRRNKLPHGWQQYERRKRLRGRSLALPADRITTNEVYAKEDVVGYFWEDPSELLYLQTGKPRLSFEGDDEHWKDIDDDLDQTYDKLFSKPPRVKKKSFSPSGLVGPGSRRGGFNNIDSNEDQEDEGDDDDDDDSDEMRDKEENKDAGIFTSFPLFPTRAHTRRSTLMKDLFSDPQWKAQWYAKRWPHVLKINENEQDVRSVQQQQQQRNMHTVVPDTTRSREQSRKRFLLQNIPSDFFQSKELASLSKEEVMNAITTYISSKEKRSVSRRRRFSDQQELLQNRAFSKVNMTVNMPSKEEEEEEYYTVRNTDSSFSNVSRKVDEPNKVNTASSGDSERLLLIERRRIRSEKAKRAYETRRRNLQALKRDERVDEKMDKNKRKKSKTNIETIT